MILLLGTSTDPHIEHLSGRLASAGARPVSVALDQIPRGGWCRYGLSGATEPELLLPGEDASLSPSDIRAVLFRNLTLLRAERLWGDVPSEIRQFATRETEEALAGLYSLLRDCRWVNDWRAAAGADAKVMQLDLARGIGLAIPATLITDDADSVRAFYSEHNGDIIYKSLSVPVVSSTETKRQFLYTSRLEREHLEQLDSLMRVPGLFQARVERAREFRVTVVGSRAFVAEVRVPDDAPPDWRRGSGSYTDFTVGTLDEEVEAKLVALVGRLGLRYAALDLIERPDGEIVFLEANPAGAWLWLEEALGLAISDAIVAELLGDEA